MGFSSFGSGGVGGTALVSLPYVLEKEVEGVTGLLIPGIPSTTIREIWIENTGGDCLLKWSENGIPKPLPYTHTYIDNSCGHDIYVEGENVKLKVSIRQNKPFDYSIGETIMIPVKVRLLIGTGTNFTPRNESDFDSDSTQYLINLYKLKNSDSGATGFKLFDVFIFHPGERIDFDVTIENPAKYGNIALQLFDPISVGEALFDVANDVVNLELNSLSDTFIGNVTRNALYKDVITNKVSVWPDFSRHVGRFVAINTVTGKFDTAIIKSYTPNSDIYKGGTFVLTGEF